MMRRAGVVAAGAAGAAVLCLVVVMGGAGHRAELFEWKADPSQRVYQHPRLSPVQRAKQALLRAEQRVRLDEERLERTEGVWHKKAQLSDMSVSVFPKYGPKSDLEHEDDGLSTPRAAHHPPFGTNKRHCPGGNCETLDREGVATDRWPIDVYSGMPNPAWDPEADPKRLRDQNRRTGEFSGNMHRENYHPPVQWGINTHGDGGSMAAEDRGAKRLEEAGVNHDAWPFDVKKAMPNPAWDASEEGVKGLTDPMDTISDNQSDILKLHEAGVRVNGLPTDLHSRTYNHVDGIYDRMVPVDDAPKWRKGGVARQEEPGHFLLRSGGIEGSLDDPQPVMDYDLGVEEEPEDESEQEEPEEVEPEEEEEDEEEPAEEEEEDEEEEHAPKRLAGLHKVRGRH